MRQMWNMGEKSSLLKALRFDVHHLICTSSVKCLLQTEELCSLNCIHAKQIWNEKSDNCGWYLGSNYWPLIGVILAAFHKLGLWLERNEHWGNNREGLKWYKTSDGVQFDVCYCLPWNQKIIACPYWQVVYPGPIHRLQQWVSPKSDYIKTYSEKPCYDRHIHVMSQWIISQ